MYMYSSRNYLSAFEEFLRENQLTVPPESSSPSSDVDQNGGYVEAGSATSPNIKFYWNLLNQESIKIPPNNN